MAFNSIDFLLFFPIVVIIYFVIPKKVRYIWLLIASYYFYMSWNIKYALLMVFSTVLSFAAGLLVHKFIKDDRKKKARLCLILCLIINLLMLAVFKYTDFVLENINAVLSRIGIETITRRFDLLMPMGISYYVFQVIGYSMDVYRGKKEPERNIFKYALFVSFFPKIVSGPIERSDNLLSQIQQITTIKVWDFNRIKDGFFLMAWGFFQKLVIADRASIVVNSIFNNYQDYGFIQIALAAFLFTIQIYCDFGGYTNIALGAAKVMGFSLIQNFRQPYLARNIRDFWKRWHISLTTWFTDYLYIPLGGNRKGTFRRYINIAIVFVVSGLWHGASWNFIVWGALHAFFQIVGDLKNKVLKKTHYIGNWLQRKTFSRTISNVVITFILVDFAWIFFACNSFRHAISVIGQMFSSIGSFTGLGITLAETDLGLDIKDWIILAVALLIVLIVDLLHEKGISINQAVNKQEIWFRWILYFGLLWGTIMLGVYGVAYDTSNFIYFQF